MVYFLIVDNQSARSIIFERSDELRKKILSFAIVLAMALSTLTAVAFADNGERYATRKEVVELILSGADTYNPGIKQSDIMKGDGDGNLRENDPVLRVEAMAMVSRAFPDLPEPKGNQLNIGSFGVTFTDLPAWAEKDLSNLTRAGIIAGYPDGRLGVDDNITLEHMQLIIRRLWAYTGENLKDDFYASVNKDWMDTAAIPSDKTSVGTLDSINEDTDERLDAIVKELAAEGEGAKEESREYKLNAFFQTAMDAEGRKATGLKPIRQLLDLYNQVNDLESFVAADTLVNANIGEYGIFGFYVSPDLKDNSVYALYAGGVSSILSKAQFKADDETAKNAYIDYVSAVLEIAGDKPSFAREEAEQLYELERQIMLASLDAQDYSDVDKIYNPMRVSELAKMFPDADVQGILNGYRFNKADTVIVEDMGKFEKMAELLTDENAAVWRAYGKFHLVNAVASLLTDEIFEPAAAFNRTMFGVGNIPTTEERALALTQSYMYKYVEDRYVEKYCTEEQKKDVTQMVEDIIAAYREKLKNIDWLSASTKNAAIKKLDAMELKIAYPDKKYDMFEGIPIDGTEKGGTLFDNVILIRLIYAYSDSYVLGGETSNESWSMPAFTVNASYGITRNEITIPAGILQAPIYDVNAKEEANLGAIGNIIAHEISHAFDNMGARFDEKGNAKNWWTDEDFEKFTEKRKAVEAFYDGVEVSNHASCDGALTLGENVADLGAMSCTLDIMKTLKDADYKAYFENYAETWKSATNKETMAYLAHADSHAPDKLRVNRVVVNFQEFYDTYEIEPGDGMYVAPEDRVKVW